MASSSSSSSSSSRSLFSIVRQLWPTSGMEQQLSEPEWTLTCRLHLVKSSSKLRPADIVLILSISSGNSLLDEQSSRIPWGEAAAFGGQLDCLKNVMGFRRDGYGIEQTGLGGGGIIGIDFFRDGRPSSFAADLPLLSKGSQMGLGSDFEKNSSLRFSNLREDSVAMHSTSSMLPRDASPTLYVEGIPVDCTPRETSHIFRPFIGFKEVRLVRKGTNKPGGEFVLCFVDFSDSRSASIALEALQGYKFDEMEPSSTVLKLQFARIPGRHGGGYGDY